MQPKLIACDPLPDVDRETDLNFFITQWRETKDPNLKSAIETSQIAENVIRSMQFKKGEALANNDQKMLSWCKTYAQTLRDIELRKFDEITAFVLEYIDVHTKMTPEEQAKAAETSKRGTNRGGDNNKKQFIEMIEQTDDLIFGIWANV